MLVKDVLHFVATPELKHERVMFVLFGTILQDLQAAFTLNRVLLGISPELGKMLDNDVCDNLVTGLVGCLNILALDLVPFFNPSRVCIAQFSSSLLPRLHGLDHVESDWLILRLLYLLDEVFWHDGLRDTFVLAVANNVNDIVSFPLLEIVIIVDLKLLAMDDLDVAEVFLAILDLFVGDGLIEVAIVGFKVIGQLIKHQCALFVCQRNDSFLVRQGEFLHVLDHINEIFGSVQLCIEIDR